MRKINPIFIAFCALLLTTPFNMGGCSETVSQLGVGGMVGAPQADHALMAGAKAVDASSLSENQEDVMGQSVALAVTGKYPLKEDAALTKYVSLVGLTLATHTSNPGGNWVFGIVQSEEVNAFAGPNGYIMITTGALAMMENEAELAGVLAHEIAHCDLHHGLKAAKQAGYAGALAEVAQAADSRASALAPLLDGTIDLVLVKGYGRDQELASDKTAVKLLIASGYDAHAYANFLERIRAGQTSGRTNLMSTHPGLDARINAVRSGIPTGTTGVQLKDRFNRNVPK